MADYAKMSVKELRAVARKAKVRGFSTLKKKELIALLDKSKDEIPFCYRIEKDGEIFGYCLPQYYAGIVTALFASAWKLDQVSRLGASHRAAIAKLKDKPLPNTVAKLPPS